MIWIIGGTTEARIVEERLNGLYDFIITVATEEGKEFLNTENVHIGRLDEMEMETFIRDNKIDIILDCSHPYAAIVSKNAKSVAKKLGISYLRVKRSKVNVDSSCELFSSLSSLTERLKELRGTFLITLGSKNVPDLVKVRGNNRFIFRVLPTVESVGLLNKHEVPMRDIIAQLGPFSKEQNLITIRENSVDYLITKESGKLGGADAKLEAAKEADIKVLLLEREDEEGDTIENLILKIESYYSKNF